MLHRGHGSASVGGGAGPRLAHSTSFACGPTTGCSCSSTSLLACSVQELLARGESAWRRLRQRAADLAPVEGIGDPSTSHAGPHCDRLVHPAPLFFASIHHGGDGAVKKRQLSPGHDLDVAGRLRRASDDQHPVNGCYCALYVHTTVRPAAVMPASCSLPHLRHCFLSVSNGRKAARPLLFVSRSALYPSTCCHPSRTATYHAANHPSPPSHSKRHQHPHHVAGAAHLSSSHCMVSRGLESAPKK